MDVVADAASSRDPEVFSSKRAAYYVRLFESVNTLFDELEVLLEVVAASASKSMCLQKKENPVAQATGFSGVNPGDDLLSHGLSHTTIGAAAFHFRVRDGIGWFHSANFTREAVGAAL